MQIAKARLEEMAADSGLPPAFRNRCAAEAARIPLPAVDPGRYEMALAEIESYFARREGAIQ